jgi:hypothetical protein
MILAITMLKGVGVLLALTAVAVVVSTDAGIICISISAMLLVIWLLGKTVS